MANQRIRKKIDKICLNCEKGFVTITNKTKFCSVSCSTRHAAKKWASDIWDEKGRLLCKGCKEYKDVSKFSNNKCYTVRNCKEIFCKVCFYKRERKRLYERGENVESYIKKLVSAIRRRVKGSKRLSLLGFDLSYEVVMNLYTKQGGKCAISGLHMTCYLGGRGRLPMNMSVDRIDSSKGYIIDNIQLVVDKINVMKSDTAIKDFIELCQLVVDNNKNK